jgi:hypothetical protein
MDPVELEAPYTAESDCSHAYGENDSENDYTCSGDEQSGEDQYVNGESDDSDEAADDLSVNEADSELDDSVASDSPSSSPSEDEDDEDDEDEEEEDYDGTVSTGSDLDEAAANDDVDTGSDESGSDKEHDDGVDDTESDAVSSDGEVETIDREVVDTVSDDNSSDSEVDDASGDGLGAHVVAEPVGDSGGFSDVITTYRGHDNITMSEQIPSAGLAQPKKGLDADTIHHHITYQVYQPTNNYQLTNTYQSYNDHHQINNHQINNHQTTGKNRKRVPRCLPEAPALLDVSTRNRSPTPAVVQKLARPNEVPVKKLKDTPGITKERTPVIRRKPKSKDVELPVDTKRPRTLKRVKKSEFGDGIIEAHELYVPDVPAQPIKATKKPKVAKSSRVIHEMEGMPVATTSGKRSKSKQQSMVHEMEGAGVQIPTSTSQQSMMHEMKGTPLVAANHVPTNKKKGPTIHELDGAVGRGSNYAKQKPRIHELEGATDPVPQNIRKPSIYEMESVAVEAAGPVPANIKKQPATYEVEGVACRIPKTRKQQPTVHEMESVPVLAPGRVAVNNKKQSTIHEMEGAVSPISSGKKLHSRVHEMEGVVRYIPENNKIHSTIHEVESVPIVGTKRISTTTTTNEQPPLSELDSTNSEHGGTMSPDHEAPCSHTQSPPITPTINTQKPWVRTSFSNPNTVLLDVIFAAAKKQWDNPTANMFTHSTYAVIGITPLADEDKEYENDGMQMYKTTDDGLSLWWKPYSPSVE